MQMFFLYIIHMYRPSFSIIFAAFSIIFAAFSHHSSTIFPASPWWDFHLALPGIVAATGAIAVVRHTGGQTWWLVEPRKPWNLGNPWKIHGKSENAGKSHEDLGTPMMIPEFVGAKWIGIDSCRNSMEYMQTNKWESIISLDLDQTHLWVWHLSRSRRDNHIQSLVKSPKRWRPCGIGRTPKLWRNWWYLITK